MPETNVTPETPTPAVVPTPTPVESPAAAPVAAPAVTKHTMYVYQNTSTIPLSIPELNMVIAKGSFSAPLPEPTETIKAYLASGMLRQEKAIISELPSGSNSGVIAGNTAQEVPTMEAAAVAKPEVKPGVHYLPVEKPDPDAMIRKYEQKAGVKDAVKNTVVAIRDGVNPNPFGEVPPEAMATILSQQGKGFSSEISSADYIDDQAQKIIAKSVGAMPRNASVAPTIPPGTPQEFVPFLSMQLLQKKIAVFKATDAAYLTNLKNYERDPHVISCIDMKLMELGPAQK